MVLNRERLILEFTLKRVEKNNMVNTSSIPNKNIYGQNYIDCGCGCGSIGLLFANLLEKASKMLLLRQHLASKTLNTAMLASSLSSSENTLLGVSQETASQTNQIEATDSPYADTIYHNGSILTMVTDGGYVEALAVKNGQIFRVGDKESVLATQGPDTRVVDLQGKCLMPGFIDPHSHLVAQSYKFNTVNLDPYPIGTIQSILDIINAVKEEIDKNPPQDGQWIVGWGYDDTAIVEMRHPNKSDLDPISTEIPIALVHISGHLIAVNSKVLELLKINSSTPDPDGGKYHRVPGTINKEEGIFGEPNGVAQEVAMFDIFGKVPLPPGDAAQFMFNLVSEGLRRYMEAGITTTTEGFANRSSIDILKGMANDNLLPIDVVAYPSYREMNLYSKEFDLLFEELKNSWKTYTNHFRLGGLKMTVDGSIQGYTAYLSQPYHIPPAPDETDESSENSTKIILDKCQTENSERILIRSGKASFKLSPQENLSTFSTDEGYRGSFNMQPEEIRGWVQRCDDNNIPFLAHTNGDAATDMLIDAIQQVRQSPRQDLRTVIIHAQTIRDDQLDFAAQQGIIPSLFPTHIAYWGDRHRDTFLGPDRARRICPAQSCVQRGIKFTLHHDAPIAGVGMLPLVSAAVNRITSQGNLLGEEQKITPFEALRAITADAAFQYFEENRKGTLEAGKLADLVILDQDPLSIDPLLIEKITVLETIKEGVTVYAKPSIVQELEK